MKLSVFMLGLALAVVGVAEVATNAFVVAEADGIRAVDETTFHVSGGGRVRAVTRSGWRFAKGRKRSASFLLGSSGYQHEVVSDLGEDGEEITYEDCTLSVSNGDEQVVAPAIAVSGTGGHPLFAYALPATGAWVSVSAGVDVTREAVHNEVVEHFPCPVCGQGPSGIERTPYTKSLSGYSWTAAGPNKTVASPTWSSFVSSGNWAVNFHVVGTNDCTACRCEADGSVPFTVYRLAATRREWVGLDRTDAGRASVSMRTYPGSALLDPSGGNVTYSWTSCGVCKFEGETDGQTVHYCATNSDAYSSSYLDQPLTVEATVTDMASGQSVSATCTTNFTVVAVDVQVSGVSEEEEETNGVYVAYAPDAADGTWTRQGTNSLVAVGISCNPPNLPESEMVTISCPAGFLYEKTGGVYSPAASTYKACEVSGRQFFLHGASLAQAETLRVEHTASGAVDEIRFSSCEMCFVTPSGDPGERAQERDSGDGQNEFTFDDASEQLRVNLKVRIC